MAYPFERLERDRGPVEGNVFVVMPFGKREFVNDGGETVVFDFDEQYHDHYVPVIESVGMTPVRADSLYEGDTVLSNVWCGLQEGAIVIADLSGSSRNVMIEFAWAYLLGKKLIPLTQRTSDMPSDLPGLRYLSYSPLLKDMSRMEKDLARQLEILAEEKPSERRLVAMETVSIRPVSARVVSTTKEHVIVEAERGQYGVLGTADVEWGRIIGDMTHRFSVGDTLNGAFETTDGYTRYTMLAGQTNPWHALAADFPQGRTFTGRVVNLIDGVGAFIRVGHGVNGLVPAAALAGVPGVDIGTQLEVGVVRMDVHNRRIQLRPLGGADRPAVRPAGPSGDLPRVGARLDAEVRRVVPENGRSGGYALVQLPGMSRLAMLHCTEMTAEVRRDMNQGELQVGELLYVEVISASRDRVLLRDLGDPPEERSEAA